MHPVFIQTFYYAVVMLLSVLVLGLTMRGFLFKYLRVRMSFGRLILVKIRGISRDHFVVGFIDESFLVYKHKKEEKRINLKDKNAIYRSVAVSWIDVDEQTNAVCNVDYSPVEGFDAIKYQNLYIRALYRPTIQTNKERMLLLLVIGAAVCALVAAWLGWVNMQNTATIYEVVKNLKGSAIVTAASI